MRTMLKFGALFAVLLLAEEAVASCRNNPASWNGRQPIGGPRVTPRSSIDPTSVTVSWEGMIKHPECVKYYTVYWWRENVDSIYTGSRQQRIDNGRTSTTVVNDLDPCVNWVFVVEYTDNLSLKSGQTKFKSSGVPKMVATTVGSSSISQPLIWVEYFYKNSSGYHDMKKAVVKFRTDNVVMYPNCLDSIEVTGVVDDTIEQQYGSGGSGSRPPYLGGSGRPYHQDSTRSGRFSRTIGQLPRQQHTSWSSSTSSRRTHSSSSSSSSTNRRDTVHESFRPPFTGGQGFVELTVPVQSCKTYRFTVKFQKSRGQAVGQIDNVILPPLSHVANFKLPRLGSVLRLRETHATIKVDMQPDSPIPPSCLVRYVDAVDKAMTRLSEKPAQQPGRRPSIAGKSHGLVRPQSHEVTTTGDRAANTLKLKQAGCTCWDTTLVNVTTGDKKIASKYKNTLGEYNFEGSMFGGRPLFVKKYNSSLSFYIFWNNRSLSWAIADSLHSGNVIFKMEDKYDLSCPSNSISKYWKVPGLLGWSKDRSMRISCMQKPLASAGNVSPLFPTDHKSVLQQRGCSCQDSVYLNLTSTDSRVLKKHKEELGLFQFMGGLHESKPYYVKKVSGSTKSYFLYWRVPEQTWFIATQLGSENPTLKMDDKAVTPCPGDPTTKIWQRKSAFGTWGDDKSMKLACYGPDRRPSALTRTSSDSQKREMLRSSGCKCYTSLHFNLTSSDSRTIRKHGDELGKYTVEALHEGKPYYVKTPNLSTGKKHYLFWNKGERTWWIGDKLGGAHASMKMEEETDHVCPSNPMTPRAKKWMRKNVFGFWSKDDSMKFVCLDK